MVRPVVDAVPCAPTTLFRPRIIKLAAAAVVVVVVLLFDNRILIDVPHRKDVVVAHGVGIVVVVVVNTIQSFPINDDDERVG